MENVGEYEVVIVNKDDDDDDDDLSIYHSVCKRWRDGICEVMAVRGGVFEYI